MSFDVFCTMGILLKMFQVEKSKHELSAMVLETRKQEYKQ